MSEEQLQEQEQIGQEADETIVPGSGADQQRASLIGRLAELHQEAKAERHLDLDIPGYGGALFARFRPYDVSATEKKVRKMQRELERGTPVVLRNACDTIIDACEQLFVRNGDGKAMPIDDTAPVRFDKRLAQLLKFDGPGITEARHVVIQLFPTQQAILKVSAEISEWLTTASNEADEDFLGNSKGTMP